MCDTSDGDGMRPLELPMLFGRAVEEGLGGEPGGGKLA
jgi:hypothetical protein